MLPNFLIIGATKGGTTTLFDTLSRHPEVWLHPQKELRFFSNPNRWALGRDWYEAQYAKINGTAAIGESSNSYSRYPRYGDVPKRIHSLLPDVKLIYLTRDPIKRIGSHYRHRVLSGFEHRTPDDAIRQEPSYIQASLYGEQISKFLRFFPASQMLVLRSEDMFADMTQTGRQICEFLGISQQGWPMALAANVTADRPIPPMFLRKLAGIRAIRKPMKRVIWWTVKSPLEKLMPRASTLQFAISPALRQELDTLFQADAALLDRSLKATV